MPAITAFHTLLKQSLWLLLLPLSMSCSGPELEPESLAEDLLEALLADDTAALFQHYAREADFRDFYNRWDDKPHDMRETVTKNMEKVKRAKEKTFENWVLWKQANNIDLKACEFRWKEFRVKRMENVEQGSVSLVINHKGDTYHWGWSQIMRCQRGWVIKRQGRFERINDDRF